jgi:hypothetical protein
VPQSERRARAIAEAYTAMGNDAFAVAERDLHAGQDFLRASGCAACSTPAAARRAPRRRRCSTPAG